MKRMFLWSVAVLIIALLSVPIVPPNVEPPPVSVLAPTHLPYRAHDGPGPVAARERNRGAPGDPRSLFL